MTTYFTNPKLHYLLLILISAFIIFFNLGEGSLWDWDEAIYASVAKEMVRTGEYLSLAMNGKYWPDKPPLIIWMMAGSFKLFGINEFAARLPVAALGWLAIILTYHMGKHFYHHWIGLVSALLLLATSHFLLLSRMAMLDVPLLFFVSLALYLFLLGLKKPSYFYLTGFVIALAVMSKGIVGLMVYAIIGLYLLFSWQWAVIKKPSFWSMVLISMVLIAPWHIHQILLHGHAFTDIYFLENLIGRVTTVVAHHSGTVFYYVNYVFQHFFTPWLILSISVLLGFSSTLIKNYKSNKTEPIYFLLVWFLTIFIFFSLSKTKVVGYIVPCYLPLAILTAKLSWDHLQLRWFKMIFFLFVVITGIHLIMLHPFKLVTIDKSKEVKELAAQALPFKHNLIVYDIPVNAPIFYFDNPIILVEDARLLNQTTLGNEASYLLCRITDIPRISSQLKTAYHLHTIGETKNQQMLLLSPIQLSIKKED